MNVLGRANISQLKSVIDGAVRGIQNIRGKVGCFFGESFKVRYTKPGVSITAFPFLEKNLFCK